MSFKKNDDSSTPINPQQSTSQQDASQSDDTGEDTTTSQQSTSAGDNNDFAQQVEQYKQEKEEYLSLLQRERADFINFRKRVEDEKKDVIVFGQGMLLMKLLPLYEQFERSFGHIAPELEQNEWVQGMRNIKTLFEKTFHDVGVERIKTVGTLFDSSCHEAMMQVPGDQGMVVSELEAGYLFKGKVIKAARVSVGNGQKPESDSPDTLSEDKNNT